jgi:hypothetical protein
VTRHVAVLGCGPAGLLAAHAASISGWDFSIYSRKVKSKLYGAQYLHQPIPELDCGAPRIVEYQLRGTPELYRAKVYGDDWDGNVSPEDYWDAHYAWDIRAAYNNLWALYEDEVRPIDIRWSAYGALAKHLNKHDLVISTVPRKVWAEEGDVFESAKIWALGDTEMPRVEPAYRPAPFHVICESDARVPWYRVSNIFGYCTIEWPYSDSSPQDGASIVEKPLRHNSTAASDFIHLGRYGAWKKGYLSHQAFFDALNELARSSLK